MRASELSERHPILRFLALASANTAPFAKPAKGAFDDPPASGVTFFAGDGIFLDNWLITPAAVFDVDDIARTLSGQAHRTNVR